MTSVVQTPAITTTRIKRKEVRKRLESLSKKFVIPPADGTD